MPILSAIMKKGGCADDGAADGFGGQRRLPAVRRAAAVAVGAAKRRALVARSDRSPSRRAARRRRGGLAALAGAVAAALWHQAVSALPLSRAAPCAALARLFLCFGALWHRAGAGAAARDGLGIARRGGAAACRRLAGDLPQGRGFAAAAAGGGAFSLLCRRAGDRRPVGGAMAAGALSSGTLHRSGGHGAGAGSGTPCGAAPSPAAAARPFRPSAGRSGTPLPYQYSAVIGRCLSNAKVSARCRCAAARLAHAVRSPCGGKAYQAPRSHRSAFHTRFTSPSS